MVKEKSELSDAMWKKISEKSIIIAPTNYLAFKKFSLYRHLDELIATLLKLNEYNIIFRPHPSNINSFNVTQILNKYSNYANFYFDKSSDYSKTYLNSFCLLKNNKVKEYIRLEKAMFSTKLIRRVGS